MSFKYIATTSAAVLALGMSFSASAAVINFDQSNADAAEGTLSYDGNGGNLVGSNISFDEINLIEGGENATGETILSCASCTINFNTGANLTEGTQTNLWTFAGGGNLTLAGNAVDSNGSVVASGNLFTGTFTEQGDGAVQLVTRTGAQSLNASLSGADDFNADLATYFGLSADTSFDFTNTVIALGSATFDSDGGFSSDDLQNADVTVISQDMQDVPEPSQLGLFALGMALVLGGLGFRRKQHGSAV